MSELRELYQEVILDHSKHPRNHGPLDDANRHADGFNPLCGDRLELHVRLEDGIVADVRFEGTGCAISTASASILTEMLKGKAEEEARDLVRQFVALVTTPMDQEIDVSDVGKMAVFAGVREFPVRVKCATLAWHTLEAALENAEDTVTTD